MHSDQFSTQEILLRPSWGIWKRWFQISLWLLVLTAGGGFGGGLKLQSFLMLLACWLIGSSLFLLIQAMKNLRQQGKLILSKTEFEVRQWGKISTWSYDEIREFSVQKTVHDRGGFPAQYHVLIIAHLVSVTRGIERILKLPYSYPLREPDPGEFLQESWKSIVRERANAKLLSAQPIQHGSWTWFQGQLQRHYTATDQRFSLLNPSAFGVFEKTFCLWNGKSTDPFIRFPLEEPNLWLLEELLETEGQAVRVSLSETPPFPNRVLFERRLSHLKSFLFGIGAVISGLAALGLFALALEHGSPAAATLASCYLLASWLMGRQHFYLARYLFHCTQQGVSGPKTRKKEARQFLPWEEIAGFRYENRPLRQGGIYLGKNRQSFVCYPNSGLPTDLISLRLTIRGTDADLEWLRDQLAEIIGREMIARALVGETVNWTSQLQFTRTQISWRRKTADEWMHIPFDQITFFEIQKSRFHLWTNYEERAVVSTSISETNFYPGLFAFERLFQVVTRDLVTSGHWDRKEPGQAVREESRRVIR